MANKNKETNDLLNQILEQVEKNNISYQLNKLLEKKIDLDKKKKFPQWIVPTAISASIAIGTFYINHTISVNGSPLDYSVHLTESVAKVSNNTDNFDKNYFTLSPFVEYTLTQNHGGKAKEMYLIKFPRSNKKELKVISATPSNTYPDLSENKKQRKINLFDYKLIWNKNTDHIFIFDSDLQYSTTTETVDTYFLILRGNNNNNEVITVLQKLGGKNEDYKDTTLSFNSLDIFDLHSWEQQAHKTNLKDFQKVYDETISEYKKVINFTKENLV
ncbi:hypothetical protein ACSSIH_002530 [Enterococcus hirae]|nr:hypothetical protein [Enterococcus hirae]